MHSHNFINCIGQVFGRLTVISFAGTKNKHSQWECLCECGKTIIVDKGCLSSGNTKSCGCLQIDAARKSNSTHGMTYAPEYITWGNIIARCTNPKNKSFKDYGGRGISICSEWRYNFMAFYKHIGPKPTSKHSIDRIKNNGNYEPGNVRWATRQVQNENSRHNHNITLYGWTLTLSNWSRFSGIKTTTIRRRIRQGWPHGKAIFYQVQRHRKSFPINRHPPA